MRLRDVAAKTCHTCSPHRLENPARGGERGKARWASRGEDGEAAKARAEGKAEAARRGQAKLEPRRGQRSRGDEVTAGSASEAEARRDEAMQGKEGLGGGGGGAGAVEEASRSQGGGKAGRGEVRWRPRVQEARRRRGRDEAAKQPAGTDAPELISSLGPG